MTDNMEPVAEEVETAPAIEHTAAERFFALQAEMDNLRESTGRELIAQRESHLVEIERINEQLTKIGYEDPQRPTHHIDVTAEVLERVGRSRMSVVKRRKTAGKSGVFSAETRRKMQESQKLRWDRIRAGKGTAQKAAKK